MKKFQSFWRIHYRHIVLIISLLVLLILFFRNRSLNYFAYTLGIINGFAFMITKYGLRKGIVKFFFSLTLISSVFLYIMFLNFRINHSDPTIFLINSIPKLMFIFIICLILYITITELFPKAISNFFHNFLEMINSPEILKTLLYLVIVYVFITFIFGIIYSSIYVFIKPPAFSAQYDLSLFDFFYYSFFVPITMGYPDITPCHWLAKLFSSLEIVFGFLIFIFYLGAIVGKVSENLHVGKNWQKKEISQLDPTNNLNKLLPITQGLNRRFADGNEPFQIATRLLEECGELAKEINHFEDKGVKREKYGKPDKSHLAKEVQDVMRAALQIAIHYDIENELSSSIEQAYTALKNEGWIE